MTNKNTNGQLSKIINEVDLDISNPHTKQVSSFVDAISLVMNQKEYEMDKLRLVVEKTPCTISWITKDLEYQGIDRTLREKSNKHKGKKIGFQSNDTKFYSFAKELFESSESSLIKELEIEVFDSSKFFLAVGSKFNNNNEAVIIGLDISDLRNTEKKLEDTEKLVEIDDLTGLYNMRSVYEKIDFELARGIRFSHSIGVIMMDMDHFKHVNDDHDHLFGSFVLAQVGKMIKRNMRNFDFGARFGGDEFLIVLTHTTLVGIKVVCERIRGMIEEHHFKKGEDSIYRTVSMGYALSDPEDRIDSTELIRIADIALYEAKNGGRNCYRGYSQKEDQKVFKEFMIKSK